MCYARTGARPWCLFPVSPTASRRRPVQTRSCHPHRALLLTFTTRRVFIRREGKTTRNPSRIGSIRLPLLLPSLLALQPLSTLPSNASLSQVSQSILFRLSVSLPSSFSHWTGTAKSVCGVQRTGGFSPASQASLLRCSTDVEQTIHELSEYKFYCER